MNKPPLIEIKNPPMSWRSGDPKVEPFMKEVSDTLDKYNLEKEVRVDIYNKAYEAVYTAIKQTEQKCNLKILNKE